MRVERRGLAMGSEVHLVAVGELGSASVVAAERTLDELESRWSRFRPDSELSRLNRSPDEWVELSVETFDVIVAAVGWWRETDGLFDPSVLDALEQAGYDRSFDLVAPVAPADDEPTRPAPGCGAVELDHRRRAVRLPRGTRLDLGGIGKGRAADLICRQMIATGARGACVNLGGDVRVAGTPPDEAPGWLLDADGVPVSLADGAVVTTSRLRRRWRRGAEERHHLIDPRTGRSADAGLASATVVAGTAEAAEVVAKAAFVAGVSAGADLVERWGVAARFTDIDGRVVRTGSFATFELASVGAVTAERR